VRPCWSKTLLCFLGYAVCQLDFSIFSHVKFTSSRNSHLLAMAVLYESPHRPWTHQGATTPGPCLEDKYEVIKEIGDGSFGSVSLARVRTAGAAVARRGTMVGVHRAVLPNANHRRSPSKP
jgi:hypothetical protein